jgi:hypothetical protein
MTLNPRPDQQASPSHPVSAGGVSLGQMNLGVPPGVGQIASVKHLFGGPSGSPYTLFTFPKKGRIWGASLSVSIAASASYAGATSNVYAELATGSGITLEIVELAVTNINQVEVDHGDMPLNGLPIAAGDTILLDVNNGTLISDTTIRASGFVLYSVP